MRYFCYVTGCNEYLGTHKELCVKMTKLHFLKKPKEICELRNRENSRTKQSGSGHLSIKRIY